MAPACGTSSCGGCDECGQAADGREASAILASAPRPDLVTINLHMPVMDGFELLRWIRGRAEFARVPLVAVSSESDPASVARAMAAGAGAFIPKPFTGEELATKVRQVLDGRPSPS